MKNYANVILMVLIYFAVFSGLMIIVGFLFTKKFNKKFRKIYILFMGLSFQEAFLLSTTFLNLIIMIYFLINVNYFLPLGSYMIVVTNFLSCLFSFNIKIIIVDLLYTTVSCSLLWLLMTINNYHSYIGDNIYMSVLTIMFMMMIGLYLLFLTIRKINLLVNLHRVNGGKNE